MPVRQQFELPFEQPQQLWSVSEIYSRADANVLRIVCEDRRLERKPPGIHANALGIYFSMWANTAPDGGILVIGMEDDGTIAGCSKLSPKSLSDLERAPEIYAPDCKCESKRVPVKNALGESDFLLLLRVHYSKAKVIKTSDGRAFSRSGSSKRELSSDEVRELEIDKGQVAFEQEASGLSYPADFDSELVREFADGVRKVRELHVNHSDTEILEHRRLGKTIAGDFIPNNACCLLFAKDPLLKFPGCKIRYLRFDGEQEGTGEKFNAIKDIPLEGPVPKLIAEAEQVIESQLRDFTSLGKDGRFYTAPEYPKAAWYEAVVNACCHRSYNLRNMVVFVKMFDDRIVVESPGPFPPLVTPKNIYNTHHPRNPFLMEAMFYLDFVKCANEGTRRMRDLMMGSNLPQPEFEQKEFGGTMVRVTLRNNVHQRKVYIDHDASKLVAERMFKSLTPDEKRVINFAAEYGHINVSQAVRLLQSNWPASKKLLEGLKAKSVFKDKRRTDLDRDTKAIYVLNF
jgi:ATP-dependent DNA helicase RecG